MKPVNIYMTANGNVSTAGAKNGASNYTTEVRAMFGATNRALAQLARGAQLA